MGTEKKAISYLHLSVKICPVNDLLAILSSEFHSHKPSNNIEALLDDAEVVATLIKQSFQKLSGTTCCILLITSTTIYCANVGDSRAILLSHSAQSLASTPLSKDHKPDEPFEKKRIIQCKGRVMPICGVKIIRLQWQFCRTLQDMVNG
jgi:serine/threonine protein phosphatase PrpC